MISTSRKKFRLSRIPLYLALILAALFYLLPVYILVVTSFKSYAEVNLATMWSPPSGIHLDSFIQAWKGDPSKGTQGLSRNFMNSVKLAIPATLLSAMLGSLNGYVLSKWKFKGANIVFPAILFGMFIPYQSVLIPLVQTLQAWGQATRPFLNSVSAWNAPVYLKWLQTIHACVWNYRRAGAHPYHIWNSYHNLNLPQLLHGNTR
jgi:ABC-type glycerol-3-phosphate transport system permease component